MAKKAAKDRGLVLGYLERISSAAFEKCSAVITELVGDKNGIYALYRNNQLYYVGLATDLRRRIRRGWLGVQKHGRKLRGRGTRLGGQYAVCSQM